MKTHLPKVNLDQRKWHVIDADGAVLGPAGCASRGYFTRQEQARLTRRILTLATLSSSSTPKRSRVTGKKETNKEFMTYSGWKGGEKYPTVAAMRAQHPEKLITHAVKGMVPKNRLGASC